VSWEPPFESDPGGAPMEALFEMSVKLADIRDHLAVIRFMLGGEDDGEEEEEAD
jgi:hypothetical protein